MNMESQSLKTIQLNYILDKISESTSLNTKELSFLDAFQDIDDSYFGEFSMLNSSTVIEKIDYLLRMKFEVICNLCDSIGPINLKINDTYISNNKHHLLLEKDDSLLLEDNCFYDLKYNLKFCRFSLESNNKYYELLPIKNE